MLNYSQLYLFGQIQTGQTGGQPYSDTSPYDECSLPKVYLREDAIGFVQVYMYECSQS